MKTPHVGLAAAAAILVTCSTETFAIEDLKISIRCPDVWLTWPSVENGETYIVQYRQTLDTNSSWLTLTNYMPPDSGTNLTTFVHSNQVSCPPGQTFGMSAAASAGGDDSIGAYDFTEILGQPKNGIGDAVPLEIYPPGTDTNSLIIFETNRTIWMQQSSESKGPVGDGPEPDGPGGGGSYPASGFYRVVRDGVHIFGLTTASRNSPPAGLRVAAPLRLKQEGRSFGQSAGFRRRTGGFLQMLGG